MGGNDFNTTSSLQSLMTKTWNSSEQSTSQFTNSTLSGCFIVTLNYYELIPSILFACVLIVGLLLCSLGYRFLRVTVFITSAIFGSSLVYCVCHETICSAFPLFAKIAVAVGIGLLLGLASVLVICIGLFASGFQLGILIAIIVVTLVEFCFHLQSIWLPIAALLTAGFVFAVVILFWQKIFLVVGSSLFGSALVALALDNFVDLLRMAEYIYNCLLARRLEDGAVCWLGWIFFALWPLLAIASAIFQWHYTAAEEDPEVFPMCHGNAPVNDDSIKRRRQVVEQLEPDEHFRHLYKIRRSNGDVISKSHMEAIEVHLSHPSLLLLTNQRCQLSTSDVNITPSSDDDATVVLTQTPDD